MRFTDIYRDEGTFLSVVAVGCRQLGTPTLTRTPIAQRFTLANGAPLVYPAELDAATMTVELECTQSQAAAIARNVRHSRLVLAGLKWAYNDETVPARKGVAGIVTGGVTIQEKFAGSGLYGVEIPLQRELDAETGEPSLIGVPAYYLTEIRLGDHVDTLDNYRCGSDGVFVRKQVFFTEAESITIGYTSDEPEGMPEGYAKNAIGVLTPTGKTGLIMPGLEAEVTVNLEQGETWFTLEVGHQPNLSRRITLRFSIYRQAVVT